MGCVDPVYSSGVATMAYAHQLPFPTENHYDSTSGVHQENLHQAMGHSARGSLQIYNIFCSQLLWLVTVFSSIVAALGSTGSLDSYKLALPQTIVN